MVMICCDLNHSRPPFPRLNFSPMFTIPTTLGIWQRSPDSTLCDIFVVGDSPVSAASRCTASWPTFRERLQRLRDIYCLADSEFQKVEQELFTTGKAKLQCTIQNPARIRALGLDWPPTR